MVWKGYIRLSSISAAYTRKCLFDNKHVKFELSRINLQM